MSPRYWNFRENRRRCRASAHRGHRLRRTAPVLTAQPTATARWPRAAILIAAISATVRAAVGGWHGKPPRLWLVTRNGLVVGDESGDPAVGALSGLIRVLAYEHPDLRATLVDFDTADETVEKLAAELGSSGSAMT